jgi:hypothetical protein
MPKVQVCHTGFEDNPLRGGVKLAHKGAYQQTGLQDQ